LKGKISLKFLALLMSLHKWSHLTK